MPRSFRTEALQWRSSVICAARGPSSEPGVAREQQDEEAEPPQPPARPAVVDGTHKHLRVSPAASRRARSRRRPERRPLPVTEGKRQRDPRRSRRAARAAGARGKQKLDLILSAPDPEQLVQALPPQELYFAWSTSARTTGRAGGDVLAGAIPALRGLRPARAGGRTAHPRGDPLAAARARGLRRSGEVPQQLWALDIELLAQVLRREMRVHDLTEEDSPSPEDPGMAY